MPRKTKQNRITSPELLKQVNPKNEKLVREFLNYLRSIDRSETTISAYQYDLQILEVFLLQQCDNKFFVDMTKRDMIAYQNWLLSDHENSPARVRRLKASVSSLSNYIESICDDDYPDYRPIVKKIENPVNTPVRENTVLSDEDCQKLLDSLVEKKEYRKACMFALAKASGRRKSELVRFKVSYFDDDNVIYGSLYRTPEKVKSKGRGRQGKMLVFYVLKKQFDPYLRLWLAERESLGIDSEWLFPDPSDPSQHMSSDTLNSWAKTFSSIMEKDFYWHSMRHFFTTALSKSGIPDDVIQSIVGWKSLDLVQVYKDIDAIDSLGDYFKDGDIVSSEKRGLEEL